MNPFPPCARCLLHLSLQFSVTSPREPPLLCCRRRCLLHLSATFATPPREPLCCAATVVLSSSRLAKEDSFQKVVMTYLLVQLDDLSTMDVCVVLDQESAYTNFLVPSLVSLHANIVLIMKKD